MSGLDVQNISIDLFKSHAGKQPIESCATDDERQAGNRLILDRREVHLFRARQPIRFSSNKR